MSKSRQNLINLLVEFFVSRTAEIIFEGRFVLEIVRGNIPVYSFQLPISLLALWCELELRTSENY